MKQRKNPTRTFVFEEIRNRIITLEYLPGNIISETDLAQQLHVSRTPIREAFVLLGNENLIEVIPRRGTFVTRIDLELVHETQFLREAIELSSLRSLTASDIAQPQLLQKIEQNLAAQEKAATSENAKEFFALDEEFHELLLHLAGHFRVWKSITDAKPHLDRARYLGFQKATPPYDFYLQHKEIFAAICKKYTAHAVQLLSEHLRAVFADTNHALALFPEFFLHTADDAPVTKLQKAFAQNQTTTSFFNVQQPANAQRLKVPETPPNATLITPKPPASSAPSNTSAPAPAQAPTPVQTPKNSLAKLALVREIQLQHSDTPPHHNSH